MGRIAFSLLLVLLCGVPVQAEDRARVELPYAEGVVMITADRLVKESEDLWRAEGGVEISYRDAVLRADHVSFDAVSAEAVAEGEVEILRGIQWLRGSRAELNLRTDTGILHDAEGFTDAELFVRTSRLVKTGPDTYRAQDGFLTACDEVLPKWSFTVRDARIRIDGAARLRHTVFRVRNVPVFYFPYLLFPTERKERSSGLMLPSTGTSSNKGRRLSQSFYLVLGRSADLMLRGDYFSERGVGYGATFRTRPHENTSLQVDGFVVQDRLEQGGALMDVLGETRFGRDWRAVADFNLVTDFVFRQVFADDFFLATRPVEASRFFLSRNRADHSLNVVMSHEETVFPVRNTVIRSTPSLGLRLSGRRLFPEVPFYLDLDASVGGMHRVDRLLSTPGLTERIDFYPRVYTSVPLFQGLRLTPRFGVRQTFYGDSLQRLFVDEDEELSLTGEGLRRSYLDAGFDLGGWAATRDFLRGRRGEFRHVLEPRFRYRYLTGIDEFDSLLRFDHVDAVADTHEVELAFFNRFLGRRSHAGTVTTEEWVSIKFGQKYFFDPDFGGAFREGFVNQFAALSSLTGFPFGGTRRRFSPLTTLIRVNPVPGYSFDVRGDYDPRHSRFRNFSVTGFLFRDAFSLATTYFVTREIEPGTFDGNHLQGQFTFGSLHRGPSVASSFSYDAFNRRLLNFRSRLNYFWDCCGVSVEMQGFNVGVRQERQVRFSFFLKGLGTFGTLSRPGAPF